MRTIRSLRGDDALYVVLEGSRYVEGPDAACDACGDVSFDGHETVSDQRFCCGCWHNGTKAER